MFEILAYAIMTKNQDLIMMLLEVIPKELLFFSELSGDYLVSLLKKYKCKVAYEFLEKKYPTLVANSNVIETPELVIPVEPVENAFDTFWSRFCDLSKQQAPIDKFKELYVKFDQLLTIATDFPIISCMRASCIAFFIGDYKGATKYYELAISNLRKTAPTSKGYVPVTLVDEMLSELTFRLFDVFSAKPSKHFLTFIRNDLTRLSVFFGIGQEAYFFPIKATLNYETLLLAKKSFADYFKFDRRLPITKFDYKSDKNYEYGVEVKRFIIAKVYDWLKALESENNLGISLQSKGLLEQALSDMNRNKLKIIHEFYGLKKSMLTIFKDAYRILEIENKFPYQAELDAAIIIENKSRIQLDEMTTKQIVNYIGEEKPKPLNESSTKNIKKKNKSNNKKQPASSDKKLTPTEVLKREVRPVESYAELPRYYPDAPMPKPVSRVRVSDLTSDLLTLFGAKVSQHNPSSPDMLKFSELANRPKVPGVLEMSLAKPKVIPEELHTLFTMCGDKNLFIIGTASCEHLLGRQPNFYELASLLNIEQLLQLLDKLKAIYPQDVKIDRIYDDEFPAVSIQMCRLKFRIYTIKPEPEDSVFVTLSKDTYLRVLTVNAIYAWLENDRLQYFSSAGGRLHLSEDSLATFSHPGFDEKLLIRQPNAYLDILHLSYRYKLTFSPAVQDAMIKAAPSIADALYTINEDELRSWYKQFSIVFGQNGTKTIFERHGIYDFFVKRGIIKLQANDAQAENLLVTNGYKS